MKLQYKFYLALLNSLLLVMVFSSSNLFAADDDFFRNVETNVNPTSDAASSYKENEQKAPVKDEVANGKLSLKNELNYRLHYAPNGHSEEYPFNRKSADFVSSRVAYRFIADYRASESIFLRFGARSSYDSRIDEHRQDGDIDEAFIDVGLHPSWRFKFGRQLIVFGQSDYFQVMDILNPRDQREIGLAEINETRLPVLATRVSYVGVRSGADFVLKHEFRPNRLASVGSDFDQFIALRGRSDVLIINDEESSLKKADVAIRYFLSQYWGDVGILAGRVYQPSPYVTIVDFLNKRFILDYPRTNLAGININYVSGNWVFKSEYVHRTSLPYMRNDIEQQIASGLAEPSSSVKKSLNELMLGARFTGINDWTVSTEVLTQNISNYDSRMTERNRQTMSVVNVEMKAMHDNLRLSLLWGRWWQAESDLLRFKAEYDATDRLTINAGYIAYMATKPNALFYPYSESDRAFLGLTYSF